MIAFYRIAGLAASGGGSGSGATRGVRDRNRRIRSGLCVVLVAVAVWLPPLRVVITCRSGCRADHRTVSQAGYADGGGRGEKGRPHRVDRVPSTAAQRIYGGAAGFPPGAADQCHQRRWHRAERISIADDGAIVVFVRGTQPNRAGWVANPTGESGRRGANDLGREDHGRRGVEDRRSDDAGAIADGRTVIYAKDGQIYATTCGRCPNAASAQNDARQPAASEPGLADAARQGVGDEQEPALVAGRDEVRVRQRPRRSLLHRRVRHARAHA